MKARRCDAEPESLLRLLPKALQLHALTWLPLQDLGALCLTTKASRALAAESLAGRRALCIDVPQPMDHPRAVVRRLGWCTALALARARCRQLRQLEFSAGGTLLDEYFERQDAQSWHRKLSRLQWGALNVMVSLITSNRAGFERLGSAVPLGKPALVVALLRCPRLAVFHSQCLRPDVAYESLRSLLRGCSALTDVDLAALGPGWLKELEAAQPGLRRLVLVGTEKELGLLPACSRLEELEIAWSQTDTELLPLASSTLAEVLPALPRLRVLRSRGALREPLTEGARPWCMPQLQELELSAALGVRLPVICAPRLRVLHCALGDGCQLAALLLGLELRGSTLRTLIVRACPGPQQQPAREMPDEWLERLTVAVQAGNLCLAGLERCQIDLGLPPTFCALLAGCAALEYAELHVQRATAETLRLLLSSARRRLETLALGLPGRPRLVPLPPRTAVEAPLVPTAPALSALQTLELSAVTDAALAGLTFPALRRLVLRGADVQLLALDAVLARMPALELLAISAGCLLDTGNCGAVLLATQADATLEVRFHEMGKVAGVSRLRRLWAALGPRLGAWSTAGSSPFLAPMLLAIATAPCPRLCRVDLSEETLAGEGEQEMLDCTVARLLDERSFPALGKLGLPACSTEARTVAGRHCPLELCVAHSRIA